MGKKKLFIGCPIHETADPHFTKCFGHLCAEYVGSDVVIYPHVGDSLITRARNHISRLFLQSDCTHLLFIDSDLVFSPEHVTRILSHQEDIVGGAYCKKQEGPPQIVANSFSGTQELSPNNDKLVKVKYVGSGFVRISRRVFEVMLEKFGDEIWYKCDNDERTLEHDFWRAGVYEYPDKTRRYLSEDWWFCQKAMDCGFSIWMDLACVLKHSGGGIWPTPAQEAVLFGKNPQQQVTNAAGEKMQSIAKGLQELEKLISGLLPSFSGPLAGRSGDAAFPSVEPEQLNSRINQELVKP